MAGMVSSGGFPVQNGPIPQPSYQVGGPHNSTQPAPYTTTPRGTVRFDPNTGYAGSIYSDPNTWASDDDYQAYLNSQQQGKAPSGTSINSGGSITNRGATSGALAGLAGSGSGGSGGGGDQVWVPQGGGPMLTQQGYEAQSLAKQQQDAESALLTQKAGLADKSFQAKFSAANSVGSAPQVQFGGGPAASDAARNAAFARAKDQAGQTGNAALQGLRDAIGSRGLQGSSIEDSGLAEIIGGTAGNVNDFTRQQLISDLNRNSEIQDETYKGNIDQRGQDLARQQAIISALINSGPAY